MSMCHWRHVTCDIHLEGDIRKYIIAVIQSKCMISTGGITISVMKNSTKSWSWLQKFQPDSRWRRRLPTVTVIYGNPPCRVGVHILFHCCRHRRRHHTNCSNPPAQIFLRWHVFCSPGHCLLNSAMTLTFWLKAKL